MCVIFHFWSDYIQVHACVPFTLFTGAFVYSTEIDTTAEAKFNIISTQGMNEEHPKHFHTGLSSSNTPLTPKTGISCSI